MIKDKTMLKVMPEWGPYSKKYFGISKIVNHSEEKGVRFDFTVLPAVSNTDCKAPNVTVPVGVHPWECKSDYSYYSYRQDLEWKDVIYADVSFTRLSDGVTLVRTEIFNNSPLMQNCLVNYFSAIQFPFKNRIELKLPEKCVFKKALDYAEFSYNTSRPWDRQTMDAMKKGEFFDGRFYQHRGLGDRDDNRYILPKYSRLGEEQGDRISYSFSSEYDFIKPVLCVRYRTTGGKVSTFTVNGKPYEFKPCNDLQLAFIPLERFSRGENKIMLESLGTGGIEFDFFSVCEESDAEKIEINNVKNNFVPEIKTSADGEGGITELEYDGISEHFYIKTFNPDTRFRKVESGCLEDALTPRLSQPDPSFDRLLETFSGEFSEKHSDDGFYQNTLVHTLFINPGSSKTEYAVLSDKPVKYKSIEEYERIYLEAKNSAESFSFNEEGKKYEFSNNLLRAAMLQNTVYPLYHHGEYVVHHTPGKRWDSFYTWDSGFIGLDMNIINPEIAEYILDLYLSDKDNPDYAFLLHGSPVPVHIYQYFDMLSRTNDKSKLYGYYERAKLFYDFLSGKINGSTTDRFKSGLTTTFDYFYNCSGMDDLPPQAEAYRRGIQLECAPCISSCQVIRTAKLLRIIALHLGKNKDVKEYDKDIKRISDALDKYSWDEDAGYYSYVVHDSEGNPVSQLKNSKKENLNKTLDGVYPLIAGITDSAKTDILLSHLKSEREMFSTVGISAVDMSAGYFSRNGYWNGNVWFSHQWFVWKTMLDLCEGDFAFKIAETALESWKKEVEYSYYTFEMLSITTGRGGWFHNFGGLSAPINLWADAYFKKGSLNCGFDSFIESSEFSGDCTALRAEISFYTDKPSLVLAVMNDKEKYDVYLNGEKAEFTKRNRGAIEIKIPSGVSTALIEVKPIKK